MPKYKVIAQQFEEYNQKAAASNAIMDKVASYATKLKESDDPGDMRDMKSVDPDDAKRWRLAIEEFVVVGQRALQNLMEYKALGCSPDEQELLQKTITKLTEDLRSSRARINSLKTGLPPSTFR